MARLKRASFPELVYRGKQALHARYLKLSGRVKSLAASPPVPERGAVEHLLLPELRHGITAGDVSRLLDEGMFRSRDDLLRIRECEEKFSRTFSGDVRESLLSCDIRAAWEPARLQHVMLLLAYLPGAESTERSERICDFARDAVIRWLDDNPFLLGIHYISAMECGLRIPVFSHALKVLDLSDRDFARIAGAIYLHAWLIARRLSIYSSLGNHTIAECTGLIFAGALFRMLPEGEGWLETGISLLRQELAHQILPDGGPAEQSLDYHRFVLDLYWLAVDFLSRNGLADCRDMLPRLTAGEEFSAAFRDCCGNMPDIGDSDSGHAIAPGIFPARPETSAKEPGIFPFPASGYTVIRGNNGAVFTFDHGLLGLPPLYNHGHADALSITLSLEGEALLVDPGTYRYNGAPELRAYFKGTRAHNTVTIDGTDQAIQETGFVWGKPYRAAVGRHSERNGAFLVEAVHDGYARLREPVRHKRTVYHFDGDRFLVLDSFWGEGEHLFELHYHLHPDAVATGEEGWWRIDRNGRRVFIQLAGDDGFIAIKGSTAPILGWFSPAYGIKRECTVLKYARTGLPREVVFATFISVGAPIERGRQEEIVCGILKDV